MSQTRGEWEQCSQAGSKHSGYPTSKWNTSSSPVSDRRRRLGVAVRIQKVKYFLDISVRIYHCCFHVFMESQASPWWKKTNSTLACCEGSYTKLNRLVSSVPGANFESAVKSDAILTLFQCLYLFRLPCLTVINMFRIKNIEIDK